MILLSFKYVYFKPLLRITRGKDTVETFATRLSLAIKHSKSVSQDEQWKYSTIAALYWRVQGDAVNAVNCLKFALLKSPDSYRVRISNFITLLQRYF